MYLNKSATLKETLYIPKNPELGQIKCFPENDPNLIKTDIFVGEASYGSTRKYQPTIWIVMNGILQKQFSGDRGLRKF